MFDDGPSCPWSVTFFGRKLLSALSHIYFLDPSIQFSDVSQFWKYLFDKTGYIAQQQELDLLQDMFYLSGNYAAYASYNIIFWYVTINFS